LHLSTAMAWGIRVAWGVLVVDHRDTLLYMYSGCSGSMERQNKFPHYFEECKFRAAAPVSF
jgi:hypothetical protein